jgi:molybdopterin synthase catalytic subunit
MIRDNPPRIQANVLSMDGLIASTARADCGALALFAGTVRDHHEGRSVSRLHYSAYAPVAERLIREIEVEIAQRFQVPVCRAIHRVGALDIGETAIIAVARGAHRAETFGAMQALVEAVKHRVPIWKEEFYTDGSRAFVNGCTLLAADELPAAASRLHCTPTQSQADAPSPQPNTALDPATYQTSPMDA